MERLVRASVLGAALIVGGLAVGCGAPADDLLPVTSSDGDVTTLPAAGDAGTAVELVEVVDADDVEILGDLDPDQQRIVTWALGRFEQVGLRLPDCIHVDFDPSRVGCHGASGVCHPLGDPPEVVVCEPNDGFAAQQLDQRITLLHELAHLWDWSHGDGSGWPDRSAIVGGEPCRPGSQWHDQSQERVAVAISWGLLDQYRRPVDSPLACVELYRQFVELTGEAPLGPIEVVCLPGRA